MPLNNFHRVCINCHWSTPIDPNYVGRWICGNCYRIAYTEPPIPDDDGSEEVKDV